MDDDLDFSCADLVHDVADPIEVCMEEERFPNGLVIDRSVRKADLERPEVSFADREPAADRPESFRDPLHVVSEGEMVLEQGLQAAFEGLVVNPEKVIDECLDVDLSSVSD